MVQTVGRARSRNAHASAATHPAEKRRPAPRLASPGVPSVRSRSYPWPTHAGRVPDPRRAGPTAALPPHAGSRFRERRRTAGVPIA